MRLDLGDAFLDLNLRVKGQVRRRVHIRVGVPTDTTPADRVVKGPPYTSGTICERTTIMDLQADKKVALSVGWSDEVGNPTDAPADATLTFTVDDPTIVAVTDNGDGTASAAAVGPLGSAFVHVEATSGGRTVSGDLGITVVAGDAERVEIVAGEVSEVTPDE